MFWANFLHIYQPLSQDEQVIKEITAQSYRPLLKGVLSHPKVKLNLNINACLLDLFSQNGFEDVTEMIKELLKRGQVELTGSAKYHAFLPLLPDEEIKRQIEQNEITLRHYFGDLWVKRGFFPPELAYDFRVAKIVKEMGYSWILAPQISYGTQSPAFDAIYEIKGLESPLAGQEPFAVYFRDKRASIMILAGYSHTPQGLFEEIPDIIQKPGRYLLTIMDGETFGHHRPGLDKFLEELYEAKELETILISDLPGNFPKREVVDPRSATWSNEEQDFWLDKEQMTVSGHPFLLWQDPGNEIHKMQWEFTNWAIEEVQSAKLKVQSDEDKKKWEEAREELDQAIASDQYWWASAKPWWSLEMIEKGAFEMERVIFTLFGEESEKGKKAQDYYLKIVLLALKMQREGVIREKFKKTRNPILDTPFKERTPADWYNQVILEFEDEMKKAATKLEYEKAIKWRDAISKLSTKTDNFDAVHAVDQLWTARKLPSIKSYLERKPEEISDFAKKHLVPMENKKDSQQQDS